MNYRCETDPERIKDYVQNAAVVAFDFETSPLIQYRDEVEAIRKQQERDESFERSVPMPGDLNNVREILRMKDIDTVIMGVENE